MQVKTVQLDSGEVKTKLTRTLVSMGRSYCNCFGHRLRERGEPHLPACPGIHWENAARAVELGIEDLERGE